MRDYCNKFIKAFSLSEVLLTLAIVGILVAITIPALIQDYKKDESVSGVKSIYSILSTAFDSVIADGNTMDQVFVGNNNQAAALNIFTSRLKITKNCGTGTGCFPDVIYKNLDGTDKDNLYSASWVAKAILSNGMLISLWDANGACINNWGSGDLAFGCGTIQVDINGAKGPNQWGSDMFEFLVLRSDFVPSGGGCNATGSTAAEKWGKGCAYKIISKGAINY